MSVTVPKWFVPSFDAQTIKNKILAIVEGGGYSTTVSFSDITNKPTTLSGYGITDAYISSGTITIGSSSLTPLTSFTETDPTVPSWAKAASKPSYTFSELTSHPTTISGYGITDAKISSGTITLGSDSITPLTSFTETDPVFSASEAASITSTDTSNWNTAFGWGDHSTEGYLKSVAFTDLTSHPSTLSGYGITDASISSGVITLGSNTITPYTSSNLSLATLAGSSALGSSTKPVYYTGSALAEADAYSTILTGVSGGALSSSGNLLSLSATSVVAGGTTQSNSASSNVKIVNSLSVSALSSTSAKNLAMKITVNGQESAEASVSDLYADKATSLETTTESGAEFTSRSTPAVAIGDSGVITKIYGNTVVSGSAAVNFTAALPVKFNQMAKAYNSSDWAALTYTTKSTDSSTQALVLTCSNNTSAAKGAKLNNFSFVSGHKYYIRANFEPGGGVGFYQSSGGTVFRSTADGVGVVGEVTSSTSYFGCRIPNGTPNGTVYHFKNIVCHDLTEMFGAGSEPTAAEFEMFLQEPYYPYSSNVDTVLTGGLKTTGTGWTSLLPLPITKITGGGQTIFPDGMKRAGEAYDELTSTKAIKRIGKVDLGTLTWNLAQNRFYAQISGCSKRTSGTSNMTLPGYTRKNANASIGGVTADGEYGQSQDYVVIWDSNYSTTAAFKTGMSGVYLDYELATASEYDLDHAFPMFFRSDTSGTQAIVPVSSANPGTAPLIADFQYGSNLGDSALTNGGYLQLNGGRIAGELNVAGELVIPTQAPKNPEIGKTYLYMDCVNHKLCVRESNGDLYAVTLTAV